MKIEAIKALTDNFIWIAIKTNYCMVIDPGEDKSVIEFIQKNQLTLSSILITHHHYDHTQGLSGILKKFPNTPVYGHHKSPCQYITNFISSETEIYDSNLKQNFKPIFTPGHTLCHICYFFNTPKPFIFTGDTLFSAGAGKIFEGTAEMLQQSLKKLQKFQKHTAIYCGHEYTLNNLKFAQTLEPSNSKITRHLTLCKNKLKEKKNTIPSTLAIELAINPFLRCHIPEIQQLLQTNNELDTFIKIRKLKDKF